MNRGLALAIEISNPTSRPQATSGPGGQQVVDGPSVALGTFDPPRAVTVLGAEALSESGRHDDDLMPAIARLCRRCNVRPRELQHIAVSVGPGGYTSLRIAVATAKMLAEATGAATIAVPSAAVAAWRARIDLPAVVCIASKGTSAWCELLPPARDDLWWTSVQPALERLLSAPVRERLMRGAEAQHHGIAGRVPIGIVDAAALESLAPRSIIADRFFPPPMREAAERLGASIVEPIFAAESVLQIAAGLPPTDPVALAPIYPREPDAVTQWRRRSEKR